MGVGVRWRKQEGMGVAIKIAVDTRKQGKVTLIPEMVFLNPVLL